MLDDKNIHDKMNHSGLLLKQAKDIITEASKKNSNLGLIKLSSNLKN
jgi:hypothetical protein